MPTAKISYSIPEAAEATGYGETTIKSAIKTGDLTPRYANRKPVIRGVDLDAWVDGLPTTSALERHQ